MARTATNTKIDPLEDLIGEAVADTEQEIFDDALGNEPLENTGDRSLEEMDEEDGLPGDDDGGDETDDVDEEQEGDEETEGEEGQEGDTQGDDRELAAREQDRDNRGRIPPSRLREESQRRQQAELERDAERAQLRALQAEVELLKRGGTKPQAEPEKPDLFADPDKWIADKERQLENRLTQREMAASLEAAAEEHGEDLHTAYQSFLRACQSGDPTALATGQRIGQAPSRAGAAIMRWHNEQAVLRDIGGDPAAYERRVAERLLADPDYRRELTARLSEDARSAGRTRVEHQVNRGRAELERARGDFEDRPSGQRNGRRLPPSLSSASGGRSHRSGDPIRTDRSTENEIFHSAFEN
jgi:hypothetical protein